MALFDSLVKPALDSAVALIGQFHMSPEEKAQAQQAIADAAEKARVESLDYDAKLNDIAGQNIRSEESSGDRFTQRARPSFMYVVISILAFNYMALPLMQVFGSKVGPIELPADLLTLFGVCITGYVCSRSAEKIASMPGDSQINLGGIVRIGNKS